MALPNHQKEASDKRLPIEISRKMTIDERLSIAKMHYNR